MAQESRIVLKNWFETGDKPTQAQFASLIDSMFNLKDDQIEIYDVNGLEQSLIDASFEYVKIVLSLPGSGDEDTLYVVSTTGAMAYWLNGAWQQAGGSDTSGKADKLFDSYTDAGVVSDSTNILVSGSGGRRNTALQIWSYISGKSASVFQSLSNLTTFWNTTTLDTRYPSEKLVKDSLDLKEDKSNKNIADGYAGLDASGKIPDALMPNSVAGGIRVVGFWDANANDPNLNSITMGNGEAFQVSVSGSTSINGESNWKIKDLVVWSDDLSGNWFKIDNTDDVLSVNGKTGVVTVTKSDIGLENVDNTSDANKPVSIAQQTAIDEKTDQVDFDAHKNNNGSDHSFINQDVKNTASPSFVAVNINDKSVEYNGSHYALQYDSGLGYNIKIGQSTFLLYYNNTGSVIPALRCLHLAGVANTARGYIATPEFADASKWEKTQGTLSVTPAAIAIGAYGLSMLYGNIEDVDTAGLPAGSQLWLSAGGTGELVPTKPEFPNYSISLGGCYVESATGKVFINKTKDIYDTIMDTVDGSFRESFDFLITSDGISITGTLTNVTPTLNLTMLLSDGFSTLDTTTAPLTVTLPNGTATIPQTVYVYILKTTKTLSTSTAGWPSTEHIKVADVVIQTPTEVAHHGALSNRNWNDHIKSEGGNGHALHLAQRLRLLFAEHISGCETTAQVTGVNTVEISIAGGIISQLHEQVWPSFAPGFEMFVVNDPTTPYLALTNIGDKTVDANGDSLNNTSYSVVLVGVQSKTGEPCQVLAFMPTGSYSKNTPELAVSDSLNHSVYSIPSQYKGKAILLSRLTFINNGGTITLYDTESLLGNIPNTTAGGGGGGTGVTTFPALIDTPSSYAGQAQKVTAVGAGETGLEFVDTDGIKEGVVKLFLTKLAQTIEGIKTFDSLATFNHGIHLSGGIISSDDPLVIENDVQMDSELSVAYRITAGQAPVNYNDVVRKLDMEEAISELEEPAVIVLTDVNANAILIAGRQYIISSAVTIDLALNEPTSGTETLAISNKSTVAQMILTKTLAAYGACSLYCTNDSEISPTWDEYTSNLI